MFAHRVSEYGRCGDDGVSKKDHPLQLILTAHGTAELVNAQDEILWASDDDDDFKEEEFPDFLGEDNFDDVLEFLHDSEVISEMEYGKFESEEWEMNIESLKAEDVGPEDEDEEDDED